ncbi:hypothetical protein GCM10009647_022160 [Streptomyces sanglieri]
MVGIVRTAAITTTAAISGMRASELMELRIGSEPPEGESGICAQARRGGHEASKPGRFHAQC